MVQLLSTIYEDKECLIVHSDRRAQYTSRAWQDMLAQRGMISSMNAKTTATTMRQWRDSSAHYKGEKIRCELLKSLQEAKEAIANWIATEYNTKRPHSALSNISPCVFEAKLSRRNLEANHEGESVPYESVPFFLVPEQPS